MRDGGDGSHVINADSCPSDLSLQLVARIQMKISIIRTDTKVKAIHPTVEDG